MVQSQSLLESPTSRLFRAFYCDDVDVFFFSGSPEDQFYINLIEHGSDKILRIPIEPKSAALQTKLVNDFDFVKAEPILFKDCDDQKLTLIFYDKQSVSVYFYDLES